MILRLSQGSLLPPSSDVFHRSWHQDCKVLQIYPQVRRIETIWTLLEQKEYERGWEKKNLDELAKRIILKTKELDEKVVTKMVLEIR